jgi:hypothetical protein
MPEPDPIESKFRVIHRAGGELNLRVTDLGPVQSRPGWGGAAPTNIRLN